MNFQVDVFLTLALVGGKKSDLHSDRFTREKEPLGTLSIGGWVGPRTVLHDVERGETLNPRPCSQ
jgi:hypothetical protein